MIISASRRTDIPAFYTDWFFHRIEKGCFLVRNPMNYHQISKINIMPDFIDCIVFWTKNPYYFINYLDRLSKYMFYFQYTINGYGKVLEPNVPNLNDSINCFVNLSKKIGSKRVIWRYDPIIITDVFDINYHVKQFEAIAKRLSGFTETCVLSFVDFYKKTLRNLSSINYKKISNDEIYELGEKFSKFGNNYNIKLNSCAEEIDLSNYGIMHGKCIDDKLIEEITGFNLKIGKDNNQRRECGCAASIDIGAYNTCPHKCKYCYANDDNQKVEENYSKHNINSELLFGEVTEIDKVSERKVYSCRINQTPLF